MSKRDKGYKVKDNPQLEDIEDKTEKALRHLTDVDMELNEIIQMCKNIRKKEIE